MEKSRSIQSHEKTAIALAALITIALGCSYVFATWSHRGHLIDGALRCITLICSLLAVHICGFAFYRDQSAGRSFVDDIVRRADLNWQVLKREMSIASIVWPQAIFIFFSSLILDGGDVLNIVCVSFLTYWITLVAAMISHRKSVAAIDFILARWGGWILLVPTGIALHAVWQWKGVGF